MHVRFLLSITLTALLGFACNAGYKMDDNFVEAQTELGLENASWDENQHFDSTASSESSVEAAKSCSVSIECSDGSTRSCNGTSGQCAASGSGNGSVTCNGATSACGSCGSPGACVPGSYRLCCLQGGCGGCCEPDAQRCTSNCEWTRCGG